MAGRKAYTGISRRVLLALDGQTAPVTASWILGTLESPPKGLHQGSIWVILDRACKNGLVEKVREDGMTYYRLTDGGVRRVKWIKNDLFQLPEAKKIKDPNQVLALAGRTRKRS